MKKTFNTLPELFNEMYKLCIRNMEYYMRDVLVDTDSIQMRVDAEEPIYNYWVVRKHGTHLVQTAQSAAEIVQQWKGEYCFTALIKGNSDDFDKCDYNYTMEIIGEAKK